MPDAFQNGTIGTLHDLAHRPVDALEAELGAWSRDRPMVLVIPSLFSELHGPALPGIVTTLADVGYLHEIVIGLDRADAAQYDEARRFFDRLGRPHRVIWHDGPAMRALHDDLAADGLAPAVPGKGRNVWYCFGYLLAEARAATVALHDADIVSYDRAMLARLLYPVAHPSFGYQFGKGYYYRSDGERLHGRVARLFVTPLLRALQKILGPNDYLDFLDSFRYPLAGECAMAAEVMATIGIPSDWGIEIGVLSEVYRYFPGEQICQVDLGGPYDHKHQPLSASDPDAGLARMATDVARAVLAKLFRDGVVLDGMQTDTLVQAYGRSASRLLGHYANDAAFNGYVHDGEAERAAVTVFEASLRRACRTTLDEWDRTQFIPDWTRVQRARPAVLDDLHAAATS